MAFALHHQSFLPFLSSIFHGETCCFQGLLLSPVILADRWRSRAHGSVVRYGYRLLYGTMSSVIALIRFVQAYCRLGSLYTAHFTSTTDTRCAVGTRGWEFATLLDTPFSNTITARDCTITLDFMLTESQAVEKSAVWLASECQMGLFDLSKAKADCFV